MRNLETLICCIATLLVLNVEKIIEKVEKRNAPKAHYGFAFLKKLFASIRKGMQMGYSKYFSRI